MRHIVSLFAAGPVGLVLLAHCGGRESGERGGAAAAAAVGGNLDSSATGGASGSSGGGSSGSQPGGNSGTGATSGSGGSAAGGSGSDAGSAGSNGGGQYAKCNEDGDCASGLLCFTCCMPVSPLTEGQCWRTSDCAPDERCADMYFCGCGAEFCVMGMVPGKCVPKVGCCVEGDCGANETCVYGVCKPIDAGQCWGAKHGCGSFGYSWCQGSSVCACGDVCDTPDVAGTCT